MMKLTVFFSWEMETDNQGFSNKKFLICCIRKALNAIQGKGDLRNVTFEFQEVVFQPVCPKSVDFMDAVQS